MSKSVLANKIGKTLFNVAKENNVLSEVDNDLTQSSEAISKDNNFIILMENPNISKEEKSQFIDKAFKGVNSYVVNVIKILAGNLEISLIGDVLVVFNEMKNFFENKVLVTVESVYSLGNEEILKLKQTMKDKLKIDNVEIKNIINSSLIGGLKISYNGKVIDSSIKARIQDIQKIISIQ